MNPVQLWLMTIATGLAVATNYYAQPLLDTIASDFDVSYAAVGIIVTASQVGYGAGLLFLVPLGDKFEKRSLITFMMTMTAAGLLMAGFSTNLNMLLLGTAISALFSAVSQVMVPFAALMAPPDSKGRVIGLLMSGLLIGILSARTLSGALTGLGSWRTVYFVAAFILLILAATLWRTLPTHKQPNRVVYGQLIASVISLLIHNPVLRLRAFLGFLSFTLFSLFWTPLAFLLSQPRYGYSEAVIGLFGLAGVAGALAANLAGKWTDRGLNREATLLGLLLLLLSWIPLGFAQSSLMALIIGAIVLDFAVQLMHISNMGVVMKINPDMRNRLNAGYMTVYFTGGAIGSLIAAAVYQYFGWTGITVASLLVATIGVVFGGTVVYRSKTSQQG